MTALLWNRLVFNKIAGLLGGRLRLIVAGGAPLSAETHEKIKLCLCADVIPGYGLTETTSGATVFDCESHLFDFSTRFYIVSFFTTKKFNFNY